LSSAEGAFGLRLYGGGAGGEKSNSSDSLIKYVTHAAGNFKKKLLHSIKCLRGKKIGKGGGKGLICHGQGVKVNVRGRGNEFTPSLITIVKNNIKDENIYGGGGN